MIVSAIGFSSALTPLSDSNARPHSEGVCGNNGLRRSGYMRRLQDASVTKEPKARGRRRSLKAESAILKATLYLLERKPLRKVTADAIARRAGVSKGTIYKWWPNKNLVALDAFLAAMSERVGIPNTGSALRDFTLQLQAAIAFYLTPLGRVFCQFIAEGQSDPGFLALFRERFLYVRLDAVRVMWRRGVDRGEIRTDVDGATVLDLIYGPALFRLLAGHGPLNNQEAAAMVEAVFVGLRQAGVLGPKRVTKQNIARTKSVSSS